MKSAKPKLTDHQKEYIAALRESGMKEINVADVGFAYRGAYLMDNKDRRK